MRPIRLRFLAVALCCTPLVASAANVTYFLDLPTINGGTVHGFEAWGTITTDGAAAPTAADVVDWSITLWWGDTQQSFVLTPTTATLAQFQGVTATPAGLFLGPDNSDYATWNVPSALCTNGLAICFGIKLGLNSITEEREATYTVLGFNGVISDVFAPFTEPFANRIPRTKPPKSFRILRHIIGLETTPTLLQKVAAAERFYEANDASDTCAQLTQLVGAAQAMGANGAVPQSTVTLIAGYANSIKMQIACAGCTG